MTGKEVVSKVEEAIEDKDENKLLELLRENPAYGTTYCEVRGLDIHMAYLKVQKVIITLGYLVSNSKK